MKDIPIERIKMQARHVNKLLEDRTTPKGKIEIEVIMLNDMLDKSRTSRSLAPMRDREELYQILKRTQTLLHNTIEKEITENE